MRVPVLSITSVLIFARVSNASASFIRTPPRADRPTATMIDIGVASPSAQGQAIISTDTNATRANVAAGSGPTRLHTTKVRTETPTTTGTNHPATKSAIL